MKVVATRTGFLNGNRIRPGMRFEWPFEKLGSWVQAEAAFDAEAAAKAPPPKPKRGQSLAEAAKALPGPLPSR